MVSSITRRPNVERTIQAVLSTLSQARIPLNSLPVSRILRFLAYIILFLNLKSAPFVWHYRVFQPVFKSRLAYLIATFPSVLSSKRKKQQATDKYLDSICPIGAHPFKQVTYYQTWASFDDCDWNLHLSNSSYPKTMDAARMKAALEMSPRFFAAGGICPLAGVSTHFIREVPMFAKYQIRVSTGSWDKDKWAYVICRVVTLPKEKKPGSKDRAQTVLNASITLPSQTISSSDTPLPATDSPGVNGNVETNLLAVKSKLLPTVEADGAVIHAIAVCKICYKIGRITVPPSLVFATQGWTKAAPATPYSHQTPPPHMSKVRELTHGGHKKYRDFLAGGWRKVPAEERWWEDALGGEVEAMRKERLAAIEGLPNAMDAARVMSVNQV